MCEIDKLLQQEGWPQESDWHPHLADHFKTDTFKTLIRFVDSQRKASTVYPPVLETFNAFRLTSLLETKVVILGQDPYHGPGQAHGLSFSVQRDLPLPPSLRNIFKELVNDLEVSTPADGDLTSWAQQGVLLLNTVLTVRAGEANSHQKKGWEQFTDEVIRLLNRHESSKVFVLWGKSAEKKASMIDAPHKVLISAHPSPLSARRGFFGSRPFSSVNDFLTKNGREPIRWVR